MNIRIHGIEVKGVDVDPETRCGHYRSPIDIIAIKFRCCETYYPCYECHLAVADHPVLTWPREAFHQKAILCGACGSELSIQEYLECSSTCPYCTANFNPGCRNHYHLYFEK